MRTGRGRSRGGRVRRRGKERGGLVGGEEKKEYEVEA